MYLDPSVGSIILQAILAGLLGIGVIVRIFWKKIKSFLGWKSNELSELESDDDDYGEPSE
jgi:hypothetical protein